MSKGNNIEYCGGCEEIYAGNPLIWLSFDYTIGETASASDTHYNCPRCYEVIPRSRIFTDSLLLRDSPKYIENVVDIADDLSDEAKYLLFSLMSVFTVPSYSAFIEGDYDEDFNELSKKRYISLNTSTASGNYVTLNAWKLGLVDNEELLLKLTHQKGFILHPEHLKEDNRKHTIRRKRRREALVDDFTNEQREALLDRFNGKCALTGKSLPIHLDHVIPLSIGHGGTTIANMLPIWQRINTSKNASNIFEWYEENGERFEVCPKRFYEAIEYLAELNGMTPDEYRDYVYECHANPNDILTEAII